MANFSSTYPSTRPVFNADFSNAGRLDSRITFSRSDTPPTYAAPSAVHYWSNEKHLSSENFLAQSSNFGTGWPVDGLNGPPTGSQADPAGGTDGWTIVENSSSGFHSIRQASLSASGELAYTVYAKRNAGSRYLILAFSSSAGGVNGAGLAAFDLAGGATHTSNGSASTLTSLSATQTASGNGYYKCVFKATGTVTTAYIALSNTGTPTANNYGLVNYTGDGTSSLNIAFSSVSTTGATDYNATTTQRHREYAPTLKSVSYAGQPRFEYSPTDSASEVMGQSRGLLIEGQFQQLAQYTEDLSNAYWTKANTTVQSNAAVAPDGTLTADLVVETTATGVGHHVRTDNFTGISSSTAYTATVFAKAAGLGFCRLYTNIGDADTGAVFNLTDGTHNVTDGSGTFSSSSVGNGWYRLQMTFTTSNTNNGAVYFHTATDSSTVIYTGNGYGSVLIWGANLTQSSHAYSYLKAEGSATTKAAESLSMTDSSLFDNGSGALAAEYDMFAANETSYVLQTARSSGATNNDGVTVYNEGLFVNGAGSNTVVGNTTSNVFHKVAASWEAGSQKISRDGGAVAEDTTTVVPQSGTDKLFIGVRQDGGEPLNGHIKRVAIFNQPLSSTNLQALTS